MSKNNKADVLEILDDPNFPLNENDFSGFGVNWKPKYENLIYLIKNLNLGLDSVVFIDDSDFECEQMRNFCSQVITIKVPKKLSEYPDISKIPFF